MPGIKLFLPFAGAFFLSHLYRSANAVVGPVLTQEFALGPGSLGLLTSAYFLAFAAAQLPLGMLLDRFGPRRIEAALLLVAAAGAGAFSLGRSIGDLAIARALIGLGVSACLMASFKAFSLWFPPERQASLTGWIMTSGGLGVLCATAPMEFALRIAGWREIFAGLAALTVAVAAWLFCRVPEHRAPGGGESFAAQWQGVRRIFASAHFWRFAPLGLTLVGGFMAIQSLWSISWLMQVNGYSRASAAGHLAAMSIAMLFSYTLIGLLATALAKKGIRPIMLFACGCAMAWICLALIVAQAVPHTRALWFAYGAFSSFGTLAYSLTAAGFARQLSGRANTAVNLLVFVGAFSLQWGLGLLIEYLQSRGLDVAATHRAAFLTLLALQLAAFVWFLAAGRRRLKFEGIDLEVPSQT